MVSNKRKNKNKNENETQNKSTEKKKEELKKKRNIFTKMKTVKSVAQADRLHAFSNIGSVENK